MKKVLSLILALTMLFSLAACKKDDTPAPGTDNIETDDTANPEEERAKKAALLLEELRSRPFYTEVETIDNDRCYVLRGYFTRPLSGVTDDLYVVYKYGGTRNLSSAVYPYFAAVDSICFSEEKDYILTVKGRVLSEDKENYTDSTAEINIYSYAKEAATVPVKPPEPQEGSTGLSIETERLIRSMLLWNGPTEIYNRFAHRLVYIPGTFSEKASEHMDGYVILNNELGNGCPATLWYLAKEMALTREDFEAYFAAIESVLALPYNGLDLGDSGKVPEIIYEGLMADTIEESMRLLKSEYAFYNDGKLYTIYEIGEMYENGTLPFDMTDSAYDEVWKNLSNYLEMQQYNDLPRDVYLLVRERAHDPVKRIYFWHSNQGGYNTCTSHSPGINYFSALDCDTYEADVRGMNERYALVIDRTYFIYDYMNGEKVCDIPLSPDEYQVDFVDFSSEEFPRYLTVSKTGDHDENNHLLYGVEKQEFVSDEKFNSCVIPKGTDLLCITVLSDGKHITTAYRIETLEEVLTFEQ